MGLCIAHAGWVFFRGNKHFIPKSESLQDGEQCRFLSGVISRDFRLRGRCLDSVSAGLPG